MAKFKTSDGREWLLAISIGSIGELRTRAGFDLGAAVKDGTALAALVYGDPEQFAGLLWVMVEQQAQSRSTDRDGFYRVLDPESLDRAGDAFLEAVVDFYHRRRAPAIKAAMPALLKTVDEKYEKAAAASLSEALKSSAGDSPGSSASTPEG